MIRAMHRRILLVEDNADDRELALLAFEEARLGCQIDVCQSAEEALDYLLSRGRFAARPRHLLPSMVLADLKLPRASGVDLLREIRSLEETRLLPVVIMTSSTEESDLVESYANHANSYIRKPVQFNAFVDTARQIGRYWLDLNEPPIHGTAAA